MKKWHGWLVCGVAALALLCAPAFAQEGEGAEEGPRKARKARKAKARGEGKKEARPKNPFGKWAKLAEETKFTAEQQEKLKVTLAAQAEEAAQWDAANGKQLAELKKQQSEARKANEKDKAAELAKQMKPLAQEQKKMQAKHVADVMAICTEEQKQMWATYELYTKTAGRYKRLKLTEDQNAKVRDLCDAAAKALAEAKDRKAQNEISKKLSKDIEEGVLTAEQLQALKTKPERKPKAEKAEKPAKPRKAKKEKPVEDDGGDDASDEGDDMPSDEE